jgi:hypothetical protein
MSMRFGEAKRLKRVLRTYEKPRSYEVLKRDVFSGMKLVLF